MKTKTRTGERGGTTSAIGRAGVGPRSRLGRSARPVTRARGPEGREGHVPLATWMARALASMAMVARGGGLSWLAGRVESGDGQGRGGGSRRREGRGRVGPSEDGEGRRAQVGTRWGGEVEGSGEGQAGTTSAGAGGEGTRERDGVRTGRASELAGLLEGVRGKGGGSVQREAVEGRGRLGRERTHARGVSPRP